MQHLTLVLAEGFRCHVHHYQCMTVSVELTVMGFNFLIHRGWDRRELVWLALVIMLKNEKLLLNAQVSERFA